MIATKTAYVAETRPQGQDGFWTVIAIERTARAARERLAQQSKAGRDVRVRRVDRKPVKGR